MRAICKLQINAQKYVLTIHQQDAFLCNSTFRFHSIWAQLNARVFLTPDHLRIELNKSMKALIAFFK